LGYVLLFLCQQPMDGEQSMAAPSHGQVDGAQKVRALHG